MSKSGAYSCVGLQDRLSFVHVQLHPRFLRWLCLLFFFPTCWPFLRKHPCPPAFLLLQMKTEEKYFFSRRQWKKYICIESQFQSGFIFFEASDWWSWSIIQELVKVVIQYEDSKLKIYYPPAVSEFSSMSCHKDAPHTNVSMGNTCCSDSYSLALCIASSMLLAVRLTVSYGELCPTGTVQWVACPIGVQIFHLKNTPTP